MSKGYKRIFVKGKTMAEHVLIAERALGRKLPEGAVVHHFDKNKANNTNSNLVICENEGYHCLLHQRQRVVEFGGNPDTDRICGKCRKVLLKTAFSKDTRDELKSYCQSYNRAECLRHRQRNRVARPVKAWGVLWRSSNRIDGQREYLIGTPDHPSRRLLFDTRREARQHIKERYGYFRRRPDLKKEPHGWKMPLAVQVVVECHLQREGGL